MHFPHRTKTQYRSAIFYLDDEQKETAEEIVAGMKASSGESYSDVEPATRFYRAEEYHQDFMSKER